MTHLTPLWLGFTNPAPDQHKRWPTGAAAFLVLTCCTLGACVNRDTSDLKKYVDNVLARPGGQIDQLPPIKPYERYLYQSGETHARDPFKSFFDAEPAEEIAKAGQGSAEQQRYNDEIAAHNREELEGFELDSLRMVGTLQNDAELWGVIKDNAGTVHRVQVGNYLGRNFGKILNIQEDRIELREVVKDTEGQWEERQASLALAELEGSP
ncbi:MAG: pilus assembly protein PilP [Gammaproteobacteria bacterium]|nr:pilus assembly protein PilP [Gammaproteobacteria bacterium]